MEQSEKHKAYIKNLGSKKFRDNYDNIMRGNAVAAGQSHKLSDDGSIPSHAPTKDNDNG